MDQKSLSKWLKWIILGIAVCGLIFYCRILPELGHSIIARYPEFSGWYWPWLAFFWLTAVPCCAVLALGWKIAVSVGEDRSFTADNARRLARIAWLAAGDTAFFLAGNILFLLLGMNHPGVVLGLLLVAFAGVAVAVAAACLSHLVGKAASLQEQSDLTI